MGTETIHFFPECYIAFSMYEYYYIRNLSNRKVKPWLLICLELELFTYVVVNNEVSITEEFPKNNQLRNSQLHIDAIPQSASFHSVRWHDNLVALQLISSPPPS